MIDSDIAVLGDWWLPANPEKKVVGTLKFFDAGERTLELRGALHDPEEEATWTEANGSRAGRVSSRSIAKAGTYPIILGVADGKEYTLMDCFSLVTLGRGMGLFHGYDYQKIHVNKLIRGAWFETDADVEADGLHLGLQGLASWVGRGGVEQVLEWEPQKYITTAQVLPTRGHSGVIVHCSPEECVAGAGNHASDGDSRIPRESAGFAIVANRATGAF